MQEFNETGPVARLPDLIAGRWEHSCGHYIHNGDIVSIDNRYVDTLIIDDDDIC